MNGHIDQIDQIVHFESGNVLQSWDDQIQSLCFHLVISVKKYYLNMTTELFQPLFQNSVIDKISTSESEWLAKTLEQQEP